MEPETLLNYNDRIGRLKSLSEEGELLHTLSDLLSQGDEGDKAIAAILFVACINVGGPGHFRNFVCSTDIIRLAELFEADALLCIRCFGCDPILRKSTGEQIALRLDFLASGETRKVKKVIKVLEKELLEYASSFWRDLVLVARSGLDPDSTEERDCIEIDDRTLRRAIALVQDDRELVRRFAMDVVARFLPSDRLMDLLRLPEKVEVEHREKLSYRVFGILITMGKRAVHALAETIAALPADVRSLRPVVDFLLQAPDSFVRELITEWHTHHGKPIQEQFELMMSARKAKVIAMLERLQTQVEPGSALHLDSILLLRRLQTSE